MFSELYELLKGTTINLRTFFSLRLHWYLVICMYESYDVQIKTNFLNALE
jgi:hypothetical protein